jgi:hypothetical protein
MIVRHAFMFTFMKYIASSLIVFFSPHRSHNGDCHFELVKVTIGKDY